MTGKQKRQLISAAICLALSIVAVIVVFVYKFFSLPVSIGVCCAVPALAVLYSVGVFLKKNKIFKIAFLVNIFGLIVLILAVLVVKSGILQRINSAEDLVKIINDFGAAGKAVFVLLQFLQVTFIPIPSTIVTAAGAALYPAWEAILLCCIGLWLGSLFAFFLGRTFGVKLVKWCIGEEMLLKYNRLVKGKDKAMLIYMFILPAFPDDMLCLIAGLTTMSYPSFILIQLISRPLNVAGTVLFVGNIKSIPFSGWGIAVWVAIGIVFVVMFILMWKYANKMEDGMMKLISKITGRPYIRDIYSIYKIKNTESEASVKMEKTAEEIFRETNEKLNEIIEQKKTKEIEAIKNADETSDNILNKDDKPISF